MSNSKPTPNPSEPSEVDQEPELIESNDQNNSEGDINQRSKKKEGVKELSKLSNGFTKGGKGEHPKVTEKRTKRKRPSREEIARIREEKRQTLREAKRIGGRNCGTED